MARGVGVGYGLLLGCLGLGAVLGAVVLPRLRERFLVDRLMAAATLLFALASDTLGAVHAPILAGVVLIGGGMAWIAVMSSINVAAQTAVSGWVRPRALAVSLLVIQGSMAGGALLWGWLAVRPTVPAETADRQPAPPARRRRPPASGSAARRSGARTRG